MSDRLRSLDPKRFRYEELVNCRSFNMLFALSQVDAASFFADMRSSFESLEDALLKRRYPSVSYDYPVPELRFILDEAYKMVGDKKDPHQAVAAAVTDTGRWIPDSLSKLIFEELRYKVDPSRIHLPKDVLSMNRLPFEQNLAYLIAESFSERGRGKWVAYIGGPQFVEKNPAVFNLLFNRTKKVSLEKSGGISFIKLDYNKADTNVRPINVNYDVCGWNQGLYDSFLRILGMYIRPSVEVQCHAPLDDLLVRERMEYGRERDYYVANGQIIARLSEEEAFGRQVSGFRIDPRSEVGAHLLSKYKDTLYGATSCVYAMCQKEKLPLLKRPLMWAIGTIVNLKAKDVLVTAYSNVEFSSQTLARRVQDTTLELREWQGKALNFLHQVVPEVIADPMLEGKFQTRELDIGVSFSDISGFSRYTGTVERKTLLTNLISYFSMVADQTVKYGGWPANFMGDCLMSVCGTPFGSKTYFADPLLIALESNRVMEDPALKEQYRIPADWHQKVGINAGQSITGPSGSSGKLVERVQYDVFGDAVNIAARLQSIAGEGQIVVNESVYEAAKRHFNFRYLGEKKLKNITESVRVYLLEGLKSVSEGGRVSSSCLLADEVERLESEVERYKAAEFCSVPFLQAEAVNGTLLHSTAVGIYSLALARAINDNYQAFSLDSRLDEESILAAGLLHDIGWMRTNRLAHMACLLPPEDKLYLEQKGYLGLSDMPADSVGYIYENLRLPEAREASVVRIIREMYQANGGIEAQILMLADVYDGLMNPPFYGLNPNLFGDCIDPHYAALNLMTSDIQKVHPGLRNAFEGLLMPRP